MTAVRRVLAVVGPDAVAPARKLLASLPGIGTTVRDSLDGADLAATDLLWLHDTETHAPQLVAWLLSGGRLLATLRAVRAPHHLGMDSAAPGTLPEPPASRNGGAPGRRGLAAFGPHPLFEGLHLGFLPERAAFDPWLGHDSARRSGGVVAVEWCGADLDPTRIVAWEEPVGDGGYLCIGGGIDLDTADRLDWRVLRALLGNALTGDAIPHRERRIAAPTWPIPAREVRAVRGGAVPDLPNIGGPWPDGASDTGRRARVAGSPAGGEAEGWIHPHRVVGSLSLPADATARWMAALEHPVLFLEVAAVDEGAAVVEWTTDLRRAWPYPPGCGGDLTLAVAADGRRALLSQAGDPFRLIVDVEEGTLTAGPVDGPAVRFTVRTAGRCTIRFTGAADDGDLERSRQMLARRDLGGLGRQQSDHANELASYLTGVEAPDRALVRFLETARTKLDASLTGTPGVGRALAVGAFGRTADPGRPGPVWYDGRRGCAAALAQLAVGDRHGPRDMLKFLSLTQDPAGRIVDWCSTGGVARYGDASVIPSYLLLAARYAAWTGELDFLAQRWSAIRGALDLGVREQCWLAQPAGAPAWAAALDALPPVAEALGHQELAEEVATHAESARAAACGATFQEESGLREFGEGRFEAGLAALRAAASAGLLTAPRLAVEGLWGVRPDALESAVRMAPWFPPDWDAMGLDRLRVGKTVLAVGLRRRFGQVSARVERLHGPRMHVEFGLRGVPDGGSVELDNVPLPGSRAAFEADGQHALTWHA